ncbi:acyltransferase family protein [Baekduia sp. Peel2402]|uniref:acyltransferase family protein n=1 Tax=Baekduia sp. Peel2402 TaxID=3458296 RepID=UPI00403E85C9
MDSTTQPTVERASTPVRDALPWLPSGLKDRADEGVGEGGTGGGTSHRARFRPEIQALRALAVSLVVAAHLWPNLVPGGYVGVDVFFAVSGFLITSLLVEEVIGSGRIGLVGFWARRARRILPAALVTLGVTAIATLILVPSHRWGAFLTEIVTSATYVENWRLAHTAVDYFAKADGISPVQHYWSLSVEEQFYLVWPLLLIGALALTRGRKPTTRVAALALAMGALTAISLAYSIIHTAADPRPAYFVTPTRAWEFGLGGLVALGLGAFIGRAPALVRVLIGWAGLAGILAAGFLYGPGTPFPGYAALLPILGTLAVIRAGTPVHRLAPTKLFAWRPIQTAGDLSYSLYLWHWPLLVLIPYAFEGISRGLLAGIVLELTVGLAWLSKRYVEDPVRKMPGLVRRPRRTLALAGLATGLVLLVPAAGAIQLHRELNADQQATKEVVSEHPRCFGAAARPPGGAPCVNPELAKEVVPTPVEASEAANATCQVVERLGRVRACAFGPPAAGAKETVALIGDSHASHWRAAFDAVAKKRGWHGLSVTHTGCPFSRATAALPQPERTACVQWNRDVQRWLERHPEIHRVFVAGHTGGDVVGHKGPDAFNAQVRGYERAWAALPNTVQELVVLRDTPKMRSATLDCVQKAMDAGDDPARACAVPRAIALEPDPAIPAASSGKAGRDVRAIDLTETLCDRRSCYPVVGGALTFKDVDHLTTVFSSTLGPYLDEAVQRLS